MDKLVNLYATVNELMAVLGADGEVDAHQEVSTNVMDALFEIDGGGYDKKAFEDFLSKKQIVNDNNIPVNAEALQSLLKAVVGPAHHIRELQTTMNLPFDDNPINILVEQFNAYNSV